MHNSLIQSPENDVAVAAQKFQDAQKNFDEGKYLNTLAYCKTALRLNPRNAKEIYMLMGRAHLELGTWESEWDFNDTLSSRVCFEKVLAIDPQCVDAYLYIGMGIVRWGNNYQLAIEYFDKVLEMRPDDETAKEYREICCKNLETIEE